MRLAFFVSAVCAAAVTLVLGGCGTGGHVDGGSQGSGRELFIDAQCGTCHTLAEAGTNGRIGPNLDDAFAQAREDGLTSATFTQVVANQIKFPIEQTSTGSPGMPAADETLPSCDDVEGDAFCVRDQDAAIDDIATYVGSVAGTRVAPAEQPGQPGETDGKSIFTANCGQCHTLGDAGTNGSVGPNLDEARPSTELAVQRVTEGIGAMPSFKDSLSPEQIRAVAAYVSSAAGG